MGESHLHTAGTASHFGLLSDCTLRIHWHCNPGQRERKKLKTSGLAVIGNIIGGLGEGREGGQVVCSESYISNKL